MTLKKSIIKDNECTNSSIDSYETNSNSDYESWIENYLTINNFNWLCKISDDFLFDNFNLFGLSKLFPKYEIALEIIRDISSLDLIQINEKNLNLITQNLYFLIHQRFLQTEKGLNLIKEKFLNNIFGICPRLHCNGQKVIPIGTSDFPGRGSCCIYCPKCCDIYHITKEPINLIDGCAFGTSFGPLFFRIFPELIPKDNLIIHQPILYGFKLHQSKKRCIR